MVGECTNGSLQGPQPQDYEEYVGFGVCDVGFGVCEGPAGSLQELYRLTSNSTGNVFAHDSIL